MAYRSGEIGPYHSTLANGQGNDASGNQARCQEAAASLAFIEQTGAHKDGDQDADFSGRSYITDRSEAQGGQHQDIGQRAENSYPYGLPVVAMPLFLNLRPIVEGNRRQHQELHGRRDIIDEEG